MKPPYQPNSEPLTDDSVERRTELFEKLIRPNINLVFSLSIRFSRNPQDIRENYTESLTNLFRYIHTYNTEKSLANWIFICTKRLIYDLDRKRAQWKTTDDVDPERIVSHHAEDSSEVSYNFLGIHNYMEYYSDDVLRALAKLKPIYREALLLQQAGYKLEEIMEIAHRNGSLKNPNIETVKSRLFLAKLKMRQMIDRDGNSKV